ncbi:hypothetical protein PCA31118_01355 [Pandoraea captiosa]|uniref:Uncharacterized protein n=1 Tax=Pandoraea captiosa TaxID=2508302 RepID=A0A5E4ZQL7_9BURK|nr:hypothetical protein [Pandoraea captiosa]VVE63691.1 hypothetical protein PCA31118_01355 [Pandoraea captiosa]
MSMSTSLQSVANVSRATLERLSAPTINASLKGARIGINRHDELVVFKGARFVLHFRECRRAARFVKTQDIAQDVTGETKASRLSSLKFSNLKVGTPSMVALVTKMKAANADPDAGIGAATLARETPPPGPCAKRASSPRAFSRLVMAASISQSREDAKGFSSPTSAIGHGRIPTDPLEAAALHRRLQDEAARLWDERFADAPGTTPYRFTADETRPPPLSPKRNSVELKRNVSLERLAHGDPTPVYVSCASEAGFAGWSGPDTSMRARLMKVTNRPENAGRARTLGFTRTELLQQLAATSASEVHPV